MSISGWALSAGSLIWAPQHSVSIKSDFYKKSMTHVALWLMSTWNSCVFPLASKFQTKENVLELQ